VQLPLASRDLIYLPLLDFPLLVTSVSTHFKKKFFDCLPLTTRIATETSISTATLSAIQGMMISNRRQILHNLHHQDDIAIE